MKKLMVICGTDAHLPRVQRVAENIKKVFVNNSGDKTVDIAVATFGPPSLAPSNALKDFAEAEGFLFYDAPRQEWVTRGREFHSCEVIGMLTLSKHFYDRGYDRVYLLHNDIYISKDFTAVLATKEKNNWGYIAPLRKTEVRDHISLDIPFSEALLLHSHQMEMTTTRISQECVIFNPLFIEAVYGTYDDEKNMWFKIFVYSNMHGDLGINDIAKNFLGFDGIFAKPFLEHGGKWQK